VGLKFRAAVNFGPQLRDAPQNAYLNLGGNFRAALMHLTEAQVAIIRAWAAATPYVDAVRLFGSYARGLAHERSDIDLAVSADAGHYVALAEEWERHLTDGLGQTVHICDFLRNEANRAACGECSVTLYPNRILAFCWRATFAALPPSIWLSCTSPTFSISASF
jgi:predicted nucleotidyltransferase